MKPVMQTKFGKEEGNSFPACLASILEIDIESVPFFNGENWFLEYIAYTHQFGYILLCFTWHYWLRNHSKMPEALNHAIVSGQSPRGDFLHAVVYQGLKPIHDPHPDQNFFIGDPVDIIVLVPFK